MHPGLYDRNECLLSRVLSPVIYHVNYYVVVAGEDVTVEVSFEHGMADIEPGVRLHYVTTGKGPRTVVLLHGFPQTWWEWRHVMPIFAEAGFRVVAPDYRGAGRSFHPASGYDKATMASDIRKLVRDHLGIAGQFVLVGHDIGLMVAYAYAQLFRDDLSHLVVADAPIPGTEIFDRMRNDPRVWHFAFHGARDVGEMLVAGRERQYLQIFYDARCFNTAAISNADLDVYTTSYAAAGAMRAGFELYRAFDEDVCCNRDLIKRHGPLDIPVLAIGGWISTFGPLMEDMVREVARNVTGVRIPGTGHWIAEESPATFAAEVLTFLSSGR